MGTLYKEMPLTLLTAHVHINIYTLFRPTINEHSCPDYLL